MTVPVLRPLDRELVEQHESYHARLADAVGAASPASRGVWMMLQRRVLVESLGYVQPVADSLTDCPLAVPPRAFLTVGHERRLAGALAAFRHLDARLAMARRGLIDHVLAPSTPVVLNALLEGPLADERETNPGMYRVTDTKWRPESNPFEHPQPAECEGLVAAAVDLALVAPAPACARAAWLTFTMLSIHPFVDGNGRTSRALYLAVANDALQLGVDWGVLEQWSVFRGAYVDALQAGQGNIGYDPARLDALPFMTFATQASIAGAELGMQRLAAIEGDVQRTIDEFGMSVEQAHVCVAIRIHRVATVAELAWCGLDSKSLLAVVDSLLASGAIEWTPRPFGRRSRTNPDEFGLVVTL